MPKPRMDAPWYRDQLLLSAVGLILSTALLGAGLLAYLREQSMREGMRLTSAFAAVIGEQTSRTLQAIDLRMERLSDTLADIDQADGGGEVAKPRIQAALRASIDALPFIDSLLLISADGKVRHTSDPTLQEADLSNRDYLTIYRTRPRTGFFIGAPVVGPNGEWLLPIARPLGNDRPGSAGVLLANIRVLHFDRLWASLALEADTSVGLLRSDGQMLLRSPIDGSAMGRSFSQSPLFLQHLPSSPHGGYRILSTIDGKDRYIGYRTLAQQPNLVVIVGRTIDAILAPWYRLALLVVGVWVAASLGLMLLSIRLTRQSARRKRAERVNTALAQRLSIASESAGLVLWEWDLASDSWDVTPTYYTTLGYPSQTGAVTQAHWQALVHPDDQARVQLQSSHIRAHANDKYDQLFRVRHADASYRWMRITGQVHTRDAQGRPTRRIGICIDVTDRVLAEQERQQMVERISDALVTISADWRITHANARAGALLGHQPEALIGQDIWTVFPASVGFRFREVCERCVATQKPEVFEEYYAPTDIWYESHIYPSPEGLSVYFRDITQRKLSEQALRDAKEQAENLINGANVMVVGLNTQGQITIFNKMAQELTGYTLADLAGRNWFEILAPSERYPHVHAEFERLSAGGLPEQFESPILTATGEERVIAWQTSVLHDGDTITGTLSFGLDVSLRRKAERELAESKEQFETLANSSLQGIVLIRKSHFVYVNPAYCAIVGRRAAELSHISVQQVMQWIHPDDRAASMERHQRAAAGDAIPHVNEFRLLTGQGQWRWIQVATRSITLGGVPAVLGMLLDVHDRHLAEEALRTSEERFRSAFDSSGSGIGLTSLDGRWLQVNASLCQIVGYTADALCQRTFMDITHPDDLALDLSRMDELLAGRVPHFTMEKRYLHRCGQPVWVNLTVALVRSADGSPLYTVAQIENIDRRKNLEIRAEQEQAMLQYLASSRPLPEILEKFVLSFETQMPGMMGSVLLVEPDGRHLRHGAAPHLPAAYCAAIDGEAIGPVVGPRATAAFTGETVVVTDIRTDPLWADYRDLAAQFDLRACWSVPIKGVQGQVLGIFAFYFDHVRVPQAAERLAIEHGAKLASQAIERHLAVQALQRSEARYRSVVEWSPMGIMIEQNGRIVYCNPAAVQIHGAASAQDLLGMPIADRVHPDDRARVARLDKQVRDRNESTEQIEIRCLRLDGSVVDLQTRGAPTAFEGAPALQVVMLDITARKEAEAALRASRQQLRLLSARVLAAQETERRRVAHELHDELGQSLTAIKINLQSQSLIDGEAPDAEPYAENIRIVEQALQHVRQLALALRPSMLDDLGLVSALRWLTNQVSQRHKVCVQLKVSDAVGRIAPDTETAVFRIVQEALTNIERHANAETAQVSADIEAEDEFAVRIIDNGCGFDVAAMQAQASAGASMGVLGMDERATLIGGTLRITSTPGVGTTVTLRCPLTNRGNG